MKLSDDDILKDISEKFARKRNDFPRGGALDYPSVLTGWISQLEANALPYMTAGANAADGGGHLTMHDKEHVARVRQVCADLIGQSGVIDLTPFELTLLLVAVYLHDIGNVLGRAGHERQIHRAVQAVGAGIAIDQIEYAIAKQIARGGSRNLNSGDKWIADLTAVMLAAKRRQDEQATPPESQPGIQGEGGTGCCEGREDASRAGAAV